MFRDQSLEFRGLSLRILKKSVFLCVNLWLISLFAFVVQAQVQPIYDRGAMGLGQMLKRLNNTKRVMHVGAHPDDEDSFLLAYLARGENTRTVYLSLTRGDGGQNVIGPELFEPLGIIRTEELLQARRLDGAEQLFTRAFDYGYSKTLAEAKSKWDEQVIKCDVVRAIRSFRPQVVISRFAGTPNDGHGQHQFSGYITPIAIEAAADKNQCKDAGMPWQVLKFYVGQSFRSRSEPQLNINTGKYDFLLGRSYFEIAAEGRSQHKSQEQGFPELKGDRFSGLNLVWSKVRKVENEKSVFDGIDTSYTDLLNRFGFANDKELPELVKRLDKLVSELPKEIGLKDNDELIKNLIKGHNLAFLAGGILDLRGYPVIARKNKKQFTKIGFANDKRKRRITPHPFITVMLQKAGEFKKAIKLVSGLQIDALANSETVTKNEEFSTTVKVFHPKNSNIKIKKIKLKHPFGWEVSNGKETQSNSGFARFFREIPRESKTFNVKVSENAKPTQPYFLEQKKENYLYKLDESGYVNAPFQKPLMSADVTIEINGEEITFNQPVQHRIRDQIRGELRRNVHVVPKVSVKMERGLVVSPRQKEPSNHKLSVSLVSNSQKAISGKLYLKLPNGQKIKMTPPKEKNLRGDDWFYEVKNWKVSPESVDFNLKRKGESVSYDFEVEIPPFEQRANYEIEAVAEINGEKFTQTLNKVAYEHIQTHRYYTEAKTDVRVLDLKVADVKVGYIEGTGDRVPELIQQLGIDVEFLDKKFLTNGDFSKFDLIVVGIRASEARPDYIANNGRLLEYVRNGGTMIVQYQKFAYQRLNLAPFPFSYNARVAEENAKITILEPNHPVFNFPNKITQDDFLNWVQERNLYAFRTFDERYTSLLEAHDTGEEDNKGGMVYAEIGKGKYMYVSYAFFRQLPAGVSGAYRLYANILSLPKAKTP